MSDFKAIAQFPPAWFRSAEMLMAAAEAVLSDCEAAGKEFKNALETGDIPVGLHTPTQRELNLLPRIQSGRVHRVLVALALENLAKGILIARAPSLVTDGDLHQGLRGKHTKLPTWVEQTGISLDGPELDVLQRLGEAAHWAGRYPVPLTQAEMKARPTPDWRLPPDLPAEFYPVVETPGTPFSQDLEVIQRVWAALREEVRKVMSDRAKPSW